MSDKKLTHFGFPPPSPERFVQAVLSQALAIGQGFDVHGSASLTSLLGPLFDFSAMPTKTIDFLGTQVEVPIIVDWIGGTTTEILEGYDQSRSAFQDSMSGRLGVSTRVGAFSGEVQASFATSSSRSDELTYSYRKFYSQLGIFQYQPGYEQYLTKELQEAVERLPSSVDELNIVDFEAFFNRFGVYFVTGAIPGANLTYGATLAKSAGMTSEEITASAKASYGALFGGVSISAEFTAGRAWQSYTANAEVRVSTRGGDPVLAAALATADPFNSSSGATTGAFLDWVQSAEAEPANIDFRVTGIWELAGDKRTVIQTAWELFGPRLRPALDLTSTVFAHPLLHRPERPLIQLNGKLIDVPDEPGAMGIDVLILDGQDILAPPLFRRQFGMSAERWTWEFQALWNRVAREITASGVATSPNLLIIASYNFEWNAVPTSDAGNIFLSAGAARVLPDWVDMSDPGSVLGSSQVTLHAMNLLFAGFFGGARGSAVEVYKRLPFAAGPLRTSLGIVFNRQVTGARYAVEAVETRS